IPESELELVESFCFETEANDPLDINEITVQFVACPSILDNDDLEDVYFSLQFYRFPEVITSRMKFGGSFDTCTDQPGSCCRILEPSMPEVGNRSVPKGVKITGCQVTFTMDPNWMNPGEYEEFFDYLLYKTLQVDVWNAKSHMLVGSTASEMTQLCRQQKPAVQVSIKSVVMHTGEWSESYRENLTDDAMPGHLHLRLSNLGRSSGTPRNQVAAFNKRTNSLLIDSHMDSTFLRFRGGALSDACEFQLLQSQNTLSQPKTESFGTVVRARALKEVSTELRALLKKVQGGYSRPDTSKDLSSAYQGGEVELTRFYAAVQGTEYGSLSDSYVRLLRSGVGEMDKSEELNITERYRNQKKQEQIERMLSIPTIVEHCLYTSFGCTEFFEFELCNPSEQEDVLEISIEGDSKTLETIVDPNEVKALKSAFGPCTPSGSDVVVAKDPWNNGEPSLFVHPGESLRIPFKYRTSSLIERTDRYKVDFISKESKQCISELLLKVNVAHPVVDRTVRIFAPELTSHKEVLRLPPVQGFPVVMNNSFGGNKPINQHNMDIQLWAFSSDPAVSAECRTGGGRKCEIVVEICTGKCPEVRDFLLAIYIEPSQLRPVYMWRCVVHALQSIKLVTTLSCPSAQIDLSFRSERLLLTSWPRRMTVQVSHKEIKLGTVASKGTSESMLSVLVPVGVYEFKAKVYPRRTGAHQYLINLVDETTQRVVYAWILCLEVKPPKVTKSFELEFPVVDGTERTDSHRKLVSYTNPSANPKRLFLSTDRPDILQFKECQVEVPAKETVQFGLRFTPQLRPHTQRLFVFINDPDLNDKLEETLLITAHYK
ncbi:Nephrocystin-4, partial [Clonorchis sinensis]